MRPHFAHPSVLAAPRSRPVRRPAATALAVLVGLLVTACQGPQPSPGAAEADVDSGAAMADHLARQLGILGDKMVQLAEAMPEDDYEWRPMGGVRSVGAVFAHVSADNYYVPALLGRPVDGTGVTTTSGIREYEEARGSKAEIVAELTRSFEAMEAAMAESRDQLDREVLLRDTPITVGDLQVRAIIHLHEHLGQSIAYARSNGVVPPWSR